MDPQIRASNEGTKAAEERQSRTEERARERERRENHGGDKER